MEGVPGAWRKQRFSKITTSVHRGLAPNIKLSKPQSHSEKPLTVHLLKEELAEITRRPNIRLMCMCREERAKRQVRQVNQRDSYPVT